MSVGTPYTQLVGEWANCQRCQLCATRKNVVMVRGKIPCDVLFVGESPGTSEDVLGRPFVGPSGKLLDNIVAAAGLGEYRLAFANLLGCIPLGEDGKLSEPPEWAVAACEPRLTRLVEMCKPRLLVCVGKHAGEYLEQGFRHSVKVPRGLPQVRITHPAAILRANLASQGLLSQKCVVTLRNAVEEYLQGGDDGASPVP